jgi:hypothetical protein
MTCSVPFFLLVIVEDYEAGTTNRTGFVPAEKLCGRALKEGKIGDCRDQPEQGFGCQRTDDASGTLPRGKRQRPPIRAKVSQHSGLRPTRGQRPLGSCINKRYIHHHLKTTIYRLTIEINWILFCRCDILTPKTWSHGGEKARHHKGP